MPISLPIRGLQAGFWLILLAITALMYVGLPADGADVPVIAGPARQSLWLFGAVTGVLLIPVTLSVYRYFHLNSADWPTHFSVQLLAATLAALLVQGAFHLLAPWLPEASAVYGSGSWQNLPGVHAFWFWWVLVTVAWGYRALRSAGQTDEAARQLSLDLVRKGGGADAPGAAQLSHFRVQAQGQDLEIPVEEVHWIQASGKTVVLHLRDRKYPYRQSMHALEKQLNPDYFVRVHRSRMVNLDRIAGIRPLLHGDHRIVLQNGTVVNYSRRYRHRLEQPAADDTQEMDAARASTG